MQGKQVPLAKFLVTKQLTKRPEDYPDAKNQPHVQVALRRRAAGLRNGTMQVTGRMACPRLEPAVTHIDLPHTDARDSHE